MPLVSVKLIEGVFTTAQKQEMIRKLTDTMMAIEEVKSGDWGIGGNPLSVSDMNEMAGVKSHR
ncbi:MAG: tautomerase family protein [Planctomycetes bacterium]|nr:tautomerase family protein [Planctomycetota bacterium]